MVIGRSNLDSKLVEFACHFAVLRFPTAVVSWVDLMISRQIATMDLFHDREWSTQMHLKIVIRFVHISERWDEFRVIAMCRLLNCLFCGGS